MSERTAAVVVDGIVQNVIVIPAEHVLAENEIEYSDAKPAGIGWTYDGTGFIAPQPHPSWTLNGYVWTPPTPRPDDDGSYYWDEDSTSWLPVSA